MPICFILLTQLLLRAASRAACTAESNNPTNTAMMAITTSNSMSVKPGRALRGMVDPRSRLCTSDRYYESQEDNTKKSGKQGGNGRYVFVISLFSKPTQNSASG